MLKLNTPSKISTKTIALLFSAFALLSACSSQCKSVKSASVASQALTFTDHKEFVKMVEFSPNSDLVLSAGLEPVAKIWHRSTGKVIHNLVHPEGLSSADFSDDGQFIVTGSYDGVVSIWRVSDGKLIKTLTGHTKQIWGITFSPNGKLIASASADKSARIWNIEDSSVKVLSGHTAEVWGIAFSPDGKLLASSGEDNTIKLWQPTTGKLLKELNEHSSAVLSLKFSHDGKMLASGGDGYNIKLWDTQNWQVTNTLTEGLYSVYGLAFSPDDKKLVSGSRDKHLFGEFLQYHWGYTGSENGDTLRIWDVKTGKVDQVMNAHTDDITYVSYSPDGRSIASSSYDGSVIIWSVNNNL